MLLLIVEYLDEEVAGHIVALGLAIFDRAAKLRQRLALQLQVGLQNLLDRLADAKAPEHLEVGQTVEEQDAFGEAIRMLHLVDRFRSEEHTSELQSLMRISYAVFCLKKKK